MWTTWFIWWALLLLWVHNNREEMAPLEKVSREYRFPDTQLFAAEALHFSSLCSGVGPGAVGAGRIVSEF